MLIYRGGNWPQHRPWFFFIVGATALSIAWFVFERFRTGYLPGGSSPPGFIFGILGGLIIVFEMLLVVRKRYRVVRIGRAKIWLKAHIWLGLLSLPLLVLHSGFRWGGGTLSDVLMILFLIVIGSGIWGLTLQQILPTVMLDDVPAETIYSQIDYILGQQLKEAQRLVRTTCGQDERLGTGDTLSRGDRSKESFLVIGAVRTVGRVQGKVLQTQEQAVLVPESEPLLTFFEKSIIPFFAAKNISRMPLGSAKHAAGIFREIKTLVNPAAHGVVDALENLCDQRRQLAKQARLHGWLHGWMCVHVPISFAMFLLMFIHVFFAFKYF